MAWSLPLSCVALAMAAAITSASPIVLTENSFNSKVSSGGFWAVKFFAPW